MAAAVAVLAAGEICVAVGVGDGGTVAVRVGRGDGTSVGGARVGRNVAVARTRVNVG